MHAVPVGMSHEKDIARTGTYRHSMCGTLRGSIDELPEDEVD
jgi:hypothetical protein